MSTKALLTLADGRSFLAPFIDGGSCDNTVIDARIREAGERLYPKADWKLSIRRLRVQVRNEHFCLPMGVERVMTAALEGVPAPLMGPAYEFMSTGPGDLEINGATTAACIPIDIGEFPTQFDIPNYAKYDSTAGQTQADAAAEDNLYLLAFSPEADDTALELTIRGYGQRAHSLGATGIKLAINRWALGVEGQIENLADVPRSAVTVRTIERIYKPATKGHVTLYALNPSTGEMWFLAKMEPDTTIPSYRRYRFSNMSMPVVNDDHTVTRGYTWASLLVKMEHVAALYADDILPIQHLSALKLMCMALTEENRGNLQVSNSYETLAFRAMLEKKADEEGLPTSPTIVDMGAERDRLVPYYSVR
ncbi:MAG: hypothetical protein GX565_02525 [Lentisphaerae bacterium]|nr:hypothetical protein [Lentisphaerota bacterium]